MAWSTVKDFFFSEKFWLPQNVTWKDMDDESIHIPKIQELWLWFPMALFFLVVRYIWERYIIYPIGRARGVSEKKPHSPEPNPRLEVAFKQYKRIMPDHGELAALSKQTDLSIRNIERWWRRRRLIDKPNEMQRLGEISFRTVAYTFMFLFGLYVIWGKPYVWDTRLCWLGYPKHHIGPEYLWYNTLQGGFYISILLTAAFDNRQKDFSEMMLHHVTTLSMLLFSWFMNFVRVAVVMNIIHDCVDPVLDTAKVAKYLKFKTLPDILFVLFFIVWVVTRLIILPMWIGWTSFFEGHLIIGLYPAYGLMASLYMVLQMLHIYWSTFIFRIVYNRVILQKELRDERSDTEPDSENDDAKTNGHVNGVANGHTKHTVSDSGK